jgi:hypothetical protein
MLWGNIGIALGQRRSTQEKLKSITLPREWLKCGTGHPGEKSVLVPRYLCQVIFVSGHQGKPGNPLW